MLIQNWYNNLSIRADIGKGLFSDTQPFIFRDWLRQQRYSFMPKYHTHELTISVNIYLHVFIPDV